MLLPGIATPSCSSSPLSFQSTIFLSRVANNRAFTSSVGGAIGRLEKCCHDIRTWMRSNFLKLNDGKTEVLLIGSRQQLSKITLPGVTVG